jgi:hypothetical protein
MTKSNKYQSMLGRTTEVDELESTLENQPKPVTKPTAKAPQEQWVGTYIKLPFPLKRKMQGLLPPGMTMQDVIVQEITAWVERQQDT